MLSKKFSTFLFYDYETFGTDTYLDKPSQFACIRTDCNFNIISAPECFYCFPPDDYLPNPLSILITEITPQYTQKYGMNEYYFTKKIYDIFMQPNTCIIGYNNINFDDEITRNLFYRNFFDPYEWSWKHGNTRLDLLNLLRACYALRPNGINWCENETGHPIFTLSKLTQKNYISHVNVHNALSDVYATIEMAKLLQYNQPQLFNFFLEHRIKKKIFTLINIKKIRPLVYVSNFFGSIRKNVSLILPIILDQNNSNIVFAVDLLKNIKNLIIYVNDAVLEKNIFKTLFKLGLVSLHLNRCPMLAPIQILRKEDVFRLNFNLTLYKKNIKLLKKHIFIIKKIQFMLYNNNIFEKSKNVDKQIYHSFFTDQDKILIKNIRNTPILMLKNISCDYADRRLKTLLFRYRARNFFDTLSSDEKKEWFNHCMMFFNKKFILEYKNTLIYLLKKFSSKPKKIFLLQSVWQYSLTLFDKYS